MRVANGMTVVLAAAVLSTLLGPRVASAALAPIDCRICIADPSSPECTATCPAVCGDSICDPGEDAVSCPPDCAACGDGVCGPGEDSVSCPPDCTVCGDTVCGFGETPASCPDDCGPCGDGLCAPDVGEDATTCPGDCFCGDAACEPGEAGGSCPADCGPCGDGQCQPQETPCDCPVDCFCGDGVCRIDHGEDPVDCALDCPGWCGDGYCVPSEEIGAVDECPDDCLPICSVADQEPEPCPVETASAIATAACDPAVLGASDGCDCGCGAPDPDCGESAGCTEPGCAAPGCEFCRDACGEPTGCEDDVCSGDDDPCGCDCSPVPPREPPLEWSCSPGAYGGGDGCDCTCGAPDPDCLNVADPAEACPASCGDGRCDFEEFHDDCPNDCGELPQLYEGY